MEKWSFYMLLFSFFPLFIAIYGLRNTGGTHWKYLLMTSLLGVFFGVLGKRDEKMAIGLPAALFGVFAYKAQRNFMNLDSDQPSDNE
ncbi:MAG: hypothetical protein IPK32_06635 [Verrucomicrobiaceae bacterium]|nr:hypothetical protein [Verrucomicrobiaceae bacterium]